jgi:6-phosphogluconolactonase (cycloisomerase 2 family)
MRMWIRSWVPRCAAMLIWICVSNSLAAAANQPHYLITNDDGTFAGSSSVTFYAVGATGLLSLQQQVLTGGLGIAGGYFSAYRIGVLDGTSQECVYVSDALTGDIVGIDVGTLLVTGSASGSATDSGAANGIGLAVNSQYLYASFTSSNTIGTFQVQTDCSLSFVNDVSVAGLQGGFIAGMAIHGNLMVVTYGDGSIESFSISTGTPISNGDEQNSTAYTRMQGASYPNSVEITKDGHFALFGDTSTAAVVEVSDIASGKLSKTVPYSVATSINSSNILLSPDETLLYVSNTEGDTIGAAWFDKATGSLARGCISGKLAGYSSQWSYLSELTLGSNSGTGGVIYVAEFGAPSSIGMVAVSSSGGKCTLQEMTGSPVSDPNSQGLLSIGTFPPRSF